MQPSSNGKRPEGPPRVSEWWKPPLFPDNDVLESASTSTWMLDRILYYVAQRQKGGISLEAALAFAWREREPSISQRSMNENQYLRSTDDTQLYASRHNRWAARQRAPRKRGSPLHPPESLCTRATMAPIACARLTTSVLMTKS